MIYQHKHQCDVCKTDCYNTDTTTQVLKSSVPNDTGMRLLTMNNVCVSFIYDCLYMLSS